VEAQRVGLLLDIDKIQATMFSRWWLHFCPVQCLIFALVLLLLLLILLLLLLLLEIVPDFI
jgi:hypothetical protein